jgi:DNA-directed RNA polymerase subunit E'/Rpb7
MDPTTVRDYLKENLKVEFTEEHENSYGIGVTILTVKLILEGEVISEDTISVHE